MRRALTGRPGLRPPTSAGPSRIVVRQNTAFPKIAAIFADTPLETLQAWEAFHVADQAAPFLSDALRRRPLRVPRQDPPRPAGAAAALEARHAAGRRRARRGGRQALCRRLLPAAVQGQDGGAGRHIRSARCARRIQHLDLDERATKARALQKLAMFASRSATPTNGATITALQDRSRRSLRRRRAAPPRSDGPCGGQARQAGRRDRVGHRPPRR